MRDDRGVDLGVGLDLWVGRDGVRLLATSPSDGVEVGVAVDGFTDGVHDRELQLAHAQRASDHGCRRGRTAGHCGQDHQSQSELHMTDKTRKPKFGNGWWNQIPPSAVFN